MWREGPPVRRELVEGVTLFMQGFVEEGSVSHEKLMEGVALLMQGIEGVTVSHAGTNCRSCKGCWRNYQSPMQE